MEWWCWKFDQWKSKIMTSMIVLGVDQPWVWKGNIEGEQVMSVQGRATFYCSLHYSFDFKNKLSPLLVYTKNKRSLLLCAMNVTPTTPTYYYYYSSNSRAKNHPKQRIIEWGRCKDVEGKNVGCVPKKYEGKEDDLTLQTWAVCRGGGGHWEEC